MDENMQENMFGDIERDAVLNIQRYLRHLSFHDGDISPLPLDGIYDRETRESVIAFQESRGLPVTGVVDRETWERLRGEYERSVALNSPPVSISAFPRHPRSYSLGIGDESYLTMIIQHILDELERVYLFPTLSDSGIFDEITAANIREFQLRNGIPPSGEVDRETWDALAVQYNLLSGYGE